MWIAISSLIAMLAFADLGIGNGLINAIAEASGKDDLALIRRHISSASVILATISALVLCIFFSTYALIPWASIFNVKTALAINEAGPAVAAFVICFAFNITATIVQRVQLGLQMGFVSNLWQSAGSVAALIAVWGVVHFHAGLSWLVFAFAGAPLIAAVMNAAFFFGFLRRDLAPKISLATRTSGLKIIRIGALFFVLQAVVAVAYMSDNIIIAHTLGASAVTTYAVPDKLFSVIPMILAMALTPLWPAYGEAISRGDGRWVKMILKRSLISSFVIASILALLFVTFGNKLANFWLGRKIDFPFLLILSMGVWKVLEGIGSALSVFLNGANVVNIQVVIALLMAITALALKFYLINLMGISGVIWATVVSFFFIVLIPYFFLINRILESKVGKIV